MKAIFITWWSELGESYWFVPSIMAIGAIVLSFVTTAFDHALGTDWLENISWLYANKPAGARAVLSTVAGSMITVAGVTFSMTIMSISYTTSTVGARLLNNFMRDRGNQITLGVFISTFLYCLLVLRTVRNGDSPPPEGAGDVELVSAFVPHLAIITGILMAIASVGVLIYFIHHVPESIHISNIVAGVGRDLNEQIGEQFPASVGQPDEDNSSHDGQATLPSDFFTSTKKVCSNRTGYVQFVDAVGLLNIASEHDLVIRMRFRSGDFITEGGTLLLAAPEERVNDDVIREIQATYVCGAQRTPRQNLNFLFDQLVEVAMRALSPGINDPFTAINCMDWLQSALEKIGNRKMPAAHRFDDEQNLRIIAEPENFKEFCSTVFDRLRPYVTSDRNAAVHMMEMIARIAIAVPDPSQRRILVRHAAAVRRGCKFKMDDVRTLHRINNRYRSLVQMHKDPTFRDHVLKTGDWVGGRA